MANNMREDGCCWKFEHWGVCVVVQMRRSLSNSVLGAAFDCGPQSASRRLEARESVERTVGQSIEETKRRKRTQFAPLCNVTATSYVRTKTRFSVERSPKSSWVNQEDHRQTPQSALHCIIRPKSLIFNYDWSTIFDYLTNFDTVAAEKYHTLMKRFS